MQLLAVLAVLASLALAQADIGFYFFQGFQTKNAADTFYVSISATTDRGHVSTTSSTAMEFDSTYNFTLPNADKYVTNLKATLYQTGSNTPLATLATTNSQKLLSFNFYVIAHTASYDAMSGANIPKLSYNVGGDNSTSVTAVAGNYYYPSSSSEVAVFTPPPYYTLYQFPFGEGFPTQATTVSNLAVGEVVRYTSSYTESYIYIKVAAADHKFCSHSNCVAAEIDTYAGSGQSFFVVYYGNYMYNNKVGLVNYAIPPHTLQVM